MQVQQVAILQCDVLRAYFPGVLVPQHAGIRSCLVDRSLSVDIREAAVANKGHLLEGVEVGFPVVGHGAHLVLELLVAVAHHLRNGEVHGAEPGELPVALAVIHIRGSVLIAVHRVVDAHADVARGHRANLLVLQLERAHLVLRVHALDDATARCPPLVAHLDVDTVVHQQRHGQRPPDEQALQLAIALLVEQGTEARQAVGETFLADDDAIKKVDRVGIGVFLVLAEVCVTGNTTCFVRIACLDLLPVHQQVFFHVAQQFKQGEIMMFVTDSSGYSVQGGQQTGDVVSYTPCRCRVPFFTIRVLHWKQRPLGQGEPRHLRESRGRCKISDFGDDDVQHRGRDIGAGQVQQGLCIRIFVSEGIVGRSLTEIAGDVTFRHHDGTDIAAGVDVFPL